MSDPREEADYALREAKRAAKRGDVREAERWSKIAERMSIAAERLAAAPQNELPYDEEEALKAELRRRITLLAEADFAVQDWEAEAAAHRQARRAFKRGEGPEPAPLRARPYEEAALERIVMGEEPELPPPAGD